MNRSVRALLAVLLGTALASPVLSQTLGSVGIVQVPLTAEQPLYFYGDPSGHPSTASPLDSLTFSSGLHHHEVAHAPPWFAPDEFKLDYDLLFLRAVSLRRYWVEVVVHTQAVRWPPQTLWLDREAVTFRSWPEFLLEVYSVEPVDLRANPLRSAPQDNAEVTASNQDDYRVIAVQGDWLFVEGADGREVGNPRGWLRWRQADRLLVRYNLLS